jgi:hypothetical protein
MSPAALTTLLSKLLAAALLFVLLSFNLTILSLWVFATTKARQFLRTSPLMSPSGLMVFPTSLSVLLSTLPLPSLAFLFRLSFSLDFWLALPQTACMSAPSPALEHVTKHLSFATPTVAGVLTPVVNPVCTAKDLNNLCSDDFAAPGTRSSTALLSDYSPARCMMWCYEISP